MEKELLPIGSVVQLRGSPAAVMIAGYLSAASADSDALWDYSGFPYPLGLSEEDRVYSFNHEQIDLVIAYGYRDVETDALLRRIGETREKLLAEIAARHSGEGQ